mmetsp:Transcript_14984/g.16450  ORF Transcript_14984/g.16450 Transcript_14984/m.16450 type:complete len:347 (-) Transcript_14984:107-1147(-)
MIAPIVRNAIAVGTAAFAVAFATTFDANPSLYLYDKFFVNDERLKQFFQGKTIWITGASSGIGKELALRASRYGAKNLILTGRSSETLQIVADSCTSASNISILPIDMTANHDKLYKAVCSLEKILGDDNLDCVILNAGRGQLQPAITTSSSQTTEIFQVNALAPIAISQILLERGIFSNEKKRGRQQLVVTSSIGALVGLPLSSSYASSKHALQGYFNTLRAEIPWLDINLICPGTVDTSFHSNYVGQKDDIVDNPKDKNQGSTSRNMKMSLDRCVKLYISSMMLENGESWIAEQPMLAGLYINQNFPGIFQKILSKAGPLRLKAWEEGKDLYDPKTWKGIGKKK